MATWLFEFDLGAGYVDKTSLVLQETLERHMEIHKDLKPTTNEVNFQVGPDASFVNALMAGGADVPMKITKDGTRWFTGYVQRIPETSLRANLQAMSLKAYDPSILLKRKLKADYKKWGSIVSVIVGELLTLAGVASQNIGTISKTIDAIAYQEGAATYWDVIEKLFADFGYVLWFDETGTARSFLVYPSAAVSTKNYQTGETGNIIDELKVARKGARFGGARVTFFRHEARTNLIVFSDPTGAANLNKCNIDLTAYPRGYPDRAGTEDVFCEYAVVENQLKRELLATQSTGYIITGSGFVVAQYVDYGLRAALKITGSGIITKLDLVASSAILKGAQVIKESIISALSEDLDEYQADYITADADADFLLSGRRAYWANSGVTFTFKTTDTVAVGAVVTIIDSTALGYNLVALIVGATEDDLGFKRVWCEALVPYAAQAITTTGQAIQAPNPPNGIPIVQIADTTAPTVPTGLAVTQLSTGALRVSFYGSTDTESGVAIYRVYRRETSTTNEAVINDVNAAGSGPFTLDDTSPKVGKSYQYAVSAVDARGNESAKTTWSASLASVVSDPPGAVAGVSASAVIGTASVKWTAQTDAIAYQLEKSTDSGGTWPTVLTVNTNTYDDTIAAGTDSSALSTWRYRVKAISKDSVLSSTYSSVASVTVATAWSYTPVAPTIAGSIAKRSATLTLSKQANLADPDGWDVQISRDGTNWYSPNLQASTDSDSWSSGALNGFLTVYDSVVNIDFLPIPLVSGLPTAAGQVYYLRARARGKNYGAGVFASATAALVAYPGLYADLAAQQIKTANLDVNAILDPGDVDLVAYFPADDLADMPFTAVPPSTDASFNVIGGTLSGGVFTNTAGDGWGLSTIKSKYAIPEGSRINFRYGPVGKESSARLLGSNGIHYIWYFSSGTAALMMQNGVEVARNTYASGESRSVWYDGLNINWSTQFNDAAKTSFYVGPGLSFTAIFDVKDVGTSVDYISFSTDGLVYKSDFSSGVDGWFPINQATLSSENGKLKIVSSGSDPYFARSVTDIRGKTLYFKLSGNYSLEFIYAGANGAIIPVNAIGNGYYSTVVPAFGIPETQLRIDPMISADTCYLDFLYIGSGYQSPIADTSRNQGKMFLRNVTPTVGKTGKALDFGGVGWGQADRQLFPVTGDYAASWWAKLSSLPGATKRMVSQGIYWGVNASNQWDVQGYAAAADTAVHHWAVSVSGSTASVYLDGAKVWTGTDPRRPTAISTNTGVTTGGSDYWPGWVDEFRAYQRALTDAEVLRIYQNPSNGLTGLLTGDRLVANTVTAREIAAAAITAAKIGVTNLDVDGTANVIRMNAELVYSAATAQVSTAQGARLLSSGPASGKYAYNYFDLTAGMFRVGDANNYVYYDGAGGLELRLTTFKVSSLATNILGTLSISSTGTVDALTNVIALTSDATRGKITHATRLVLNSPGVASTVYVGDDATGKTQLILSTSADASGYAALQAQKVAGTTVGDLVLQLSGGNVGIGLNNPSKKLHVSGTGQFTGDLTLSSTTASSSTTTGALVVSGGVGVAGALWVGGTLSVSGGVSGDLSVTGIMQASGLGTTPLTISKLDAMPTVTSGLGNWVTLASATLPSGGTWAYLIVGKLNTGNGSNPVSLTSYAGIAAGGTTISTGGQSQYFGFCWRVS